MNWVQKSENKFLQFVPGAGCLGQPRHLPGDHQERVHEDDHQHLPLQLGPRGPGHPGPCHASRALSDVATVSLDLRRGTLRYIKVAPFVLDTQYFIQPNKFKADSLNILPGKDFIPTINFH